MPDRWRTRLYGESRGWSLRAAAAGVALVVLSDFYASPAFPLRAGGIDWEPVFWQATLPAATLLAALAVVRGGGLLGSVGVYASVGGYHFLKSCATFLVSSRSNAWVGPVLHGGPLARAVPLPQGPLLQVVLRPAVGALLWGVVVGTVVYVAGRALRRGVRDATGERRFG